MNKQTKAAYKALFVQALAGQFGQNVQRFYANATTYHKKQATVFPRPRLEAVALLSPVDAAEWIKARSSAGIPAGDKVGQRLFDAMVEAVGSL